jgi:hypothetical protein
MRFSPFFPVLVVAVLLVAGVSAFARELALLPDKPDCAADEPDSVQISWNQPCEEGNWLLDTQTGCRMWDWHPEPTDKAFWTGSCKAGMKDGKGILQWFEHGLPIDRFEGSYSAGKREGQGRYEWNDNERFIGSYAGNVPHGFGTVTLAGETLSGEWRRGCLQSGERVVAIGVPRSSCQITPMPKDRLAGF